MTEQKTAIFALGAVFIIAAFFSMYSYGGNITTTPKFWRDEAIPFEIARAFAEKGRLDVSISPDGIESRSYLTHATGFPVTVPLAVFFKFFGVGIFQSRIYMIMWVFVFLALLLFFLKNIFNSASAITGALLVTTFAPFYANGRTTTGEIPGLGLLIVALYLLYKKESFLSGGFFLALAVVSKPSMYLLVLPVIAIEFFINHRNLLTLLRDGLRVAAGTFPVFLLWIFILLPNPLRVDSWKEAINLYRAPFHEASLLSRLPDSVLYLFTHTTIIYFSLLVMLVLLAKAKGYFHEKETRLLNFVLIYGIFSFIYFLRSPGWFRFLLAFEILILFFVYPAASRILKKYSTYLPAMLISVLVIIHAVNFLFLSNIPSGYTGIETADFINKEILQGNADTIGLINMPTVAAFIASDRKYQIGEIGGNDFYGKNPLSYSYEKLPNHVVAYKNVYGEFQQELELYYEEDKTINGYNIYRKK